MNLHLVIPFAVAALLTQVQAGSVRLGVPTGDLSGPVDTSGYLVQFSMNTGTFANANDSNTFESNILAEPSQPG